VDKWTERHRPASPHHSPTPHALAQPLDSTALPPFSKVPEPEIEVELAKRSKYEAELGAGLAAFDLHEPRTKAAIVSIR
jgi:hypothetical protein